MTSIVSVLAARPGVIRAPQFGDADLVSGRIRLVSVGRPMGELPARVLRGLPATLERLGIGC